MAADNELVLTDPHISRHHLEFQIQDAGYLVRDLGSTNGTYFRGARIHEALVGPGAELRLGSTVLRLERGEEKTEQAPRKQAFGEMVGTAARMQTVFGLLAAVAPTDVTVLIEGETGTGKELVAEELHRQSPRRNQSFSIVDCGAIAANLIESELFGHERGAFTGAVGEREGVFERSRGGTVFLDEIGELPLDLQTRLLRVLDRRTIRRVGGNLQRKIDARLVAATNRDLGEEVRRGRFRQDLFYRLAVVRIPIPPLRERREDIPILARHILWQMGCADPDAVLTPEVLGVLQSRQWPGNVRELRNVVERAIVLTDGSGEMLGADSEPAQDPKAPPRPPRHVASAAPAATAAPTGPRPPGPPPIPADAGPAGPAPSLSEPWLGRLLPEGFLALPYKDAKEQLLDQFESLYWTRLHHQHGNNISHIAHAAKVDRHLVRKLLRKHGLDARQEGGEEPA